MPRLISTFWKFFPGKAGSGKVYLTYLEWWTMVILAPRVPAPLVSKLIDFDQGHFYSR